MSGTASGHNESRSVEGKIVVVTGASSGLGAAAARRLARDGAQVIAVGRSPERTARISAELGTDPVIVDFAQLDDVERAASELLTRLPRIDVLANNAGGIFGDRTKTVDGFEKTFQVNHLAPFLLTNLLMDRLISSRASVIQTSSVGARMGGRVVLEDLDHDKDFTATRAYCTAKLENILFTKELHRRYHEQGITAASFHPGNVATNFATESNSFLKYLTNNRLFRTLVLKPEQGAEQLVWLAESVPGVDWVSGMYYEKHKPARRNNPQALDAELARQLWKKSEELLSDRLGLTH